LKICDCESGELPPSTQLPRINPSLRCAVEPSIWRRKRARAEQRRLATSYPPPWVTVADHRPIRKTAAILQQPLFPGLRSHRQQNPRPTDLVGPLGVVLLKSPVSHLMQRHPLLWLQRYASISFTFPWCSADLVQRRHNEAGKGGKLANQLAADRGKSRHQHLKDASTERQVQADQPALNWD
jgi:hypothetical protein